MSKPFERLLKEYRAGHRQRHPCTCGPSSMSLVAKALGVGEFTEESWLSREWLKFLPVTEFTHRGIALHELQFVSEMIYGDKLSVTARRAYPENKELFIEDIKETAKHDRQLIVINYLQNHVLEPGQDSHWPHHSPLAGYDARKKQILIADVDIEVDTEYWASIDLVYESMTFYNPVYNLPRGWLVVRKRK